MRGKKVLGIICALLVLAIVLGGAYFARSSRCIHDHHGRRRDMCDFGCDWDVAALPYFRDRSIFYWSDAELLDFTISVALDVGLRKHVFAHRRTIDGNPDFSIVVHICQFSRGNCQPGTFYCNYDDEY